MILQQMTANNGGVTEAPSSMAPRPPQQESLKGMIQNLVQGSNSNDQVQQVSKQNTTTMDDMFKVCSTI